MPELPEVEIVRKSLDENIKGKTIKKVLIKNRNLRFEIAKHFEKQLLKKKILKVDRFSKYLIILFEDKSSCIIHLGMSGTIHLIKKKESNIFTNTSFYHSPHLPKKHNHIFIEIKDIKIIYNDPRRFGYFIFKKNLKELNNYFNKFGPEPFSKNFNSVYVSRNLSKKEKNIKNFLLDQNFVSGIGNIYANEILFQCKINPVRSGKTLNQNDFKNLIFFSRKILNKAIIKGGSTIRDFKNISGKQGSFQKTFKVYMREGKNCINKNCNGTIKKINISNRSSFFCNICQK